MIVIARKYGQLGNRLFLYAHLIAAARHYGVELRNPCFAEYANWFPKTSVDLWCRYRAHLAVEESVAGDSRVPSAALRRALMDSVQVTAKVLRLSGLSRRPFQVIRLRSGESCDLLGDRFRMAMESRRPVLLQGWLFRSEPLLMQHREAIRDFFAVGQSDQQAIRQTIELARKDSDVLVGVHLRRGDYAQFLGGQYYYSDHDYARWMHQAVEQSPGRRVRFFVCSNETLDERAFAGLDICRGPGSALGDMYSLAETDWMMGPPSTFTRWAGFVGNRPVIALENVHQTLDLSPMTTHATHGAAVVSDSMSAA